MNATARIWLVAISGSVATHAAGIGAGVCVCSWLGHSQPSVAVTSGAVQGRKVMLVSGARSSESRQHWQRREEDAGDSVRLTPVHVESSRRSSAVSSRREVVNSTIAVVSTPPVVSEVETVLLGASASAAAADDCNTVVVHAHDASAAAVASDLAIEHTGITVVVHEPGDGGSVVIESDAAGAERAGVDRQPVPAGRNRPPEYPPESRRRGESGVVLLHAVVESDGHVSSVRIASSSGHQRLDDSAIEAVRRWRFRPAEHNGSPMQCQVTLPIEFVLRG